MSPELHNHLAQINPALVVVILMCLILFGGALAISKNLSAYNTTKRRVRELVARRTELKAEYISTKRGRKIRKQEAKKEENLILMQKIVSLLRLKQETSNQALRDLLVSAGYRSKYSLMKFTLAQFFCGILFMVISLIFIKTTSIFSYVIPFLAVYLGSYLPRILVTNNKQKRLVEIRKSLPDALDLMMICTEAGLTLSAAIDRVSKEIHTSSPILAEELALTSIEIGFLPDKKKALENFAKRVELQEIRSLTSILIQTEKYGTPVSQALRVLAKEFRTQRMLRAEEKAARLPAIMTVPLILFILPTMFIIVITPSAINIMNSQ